MLTHSGFIGSRVVVFWWSRCTLSMVRTSQQHYATLYSSAIHLILHTNKPYHTWVVFTILLVNKHCSKLDPRWGTLYRATDTLLTSQPFCASCVTSLKIQFHKATVTEVWIAAMAVCCYFRVNRLTGCFTGPARPDGTLQGSCTWLLDTWGCRAGVGRSLEWRFAASGSAWSRGGELTQPGKGELF